MFQIKKRAVPIIVGWVPYIKVGLWRGPSRSPTESAQHFSWEQRNEEWNNNIKENYFPGSFSKKWVQQQMWQRRVTVKRRPRRKREPISIPHSYRQWVSLSYYNRASNANGLLPSKRPIEFGIEPHCCPLDTRNVRWMPPRCVLQFVPWNFPIMVSIRDRETFHQLHREKRLSRSGLRVTAITPSFSSSL